MKRHLVIVIIFLLKPWMGNAQSQDYAGEDKLICPGGTTNIGKSASCQICCYKWSPAYGLDDPSKSNPIVSGITESIIYSVTVSLPNGNYEIDYVTVFVYSADIDIYKPRFLFATNSADQLIPAANKKTPGAQTMVNIDNDDCDGTFDREDNLVENGDDEFVKIRVQLTVEPPVVFAHGPSGAENNPPPSEFKAMLELANNSNIDGVRLWRSNDKAEGEYFLGQPIDLVQLVGGTVYEGFIWAEGIDGQTAPQQTKLKVKAFGDKSDCVNGDYVSLTVLGILSIEWEGEGNGYTGDGKNNSNTLDETTVNGFKTKRVFAEGKYEGGSVTPAKTTVKVKTTFSTAPVESFTLFMRAFDVDDPSTELNFVDPNDAGISGNYAGGTGLTFTADEDNRGWVGFSVNPNWQVQKKYGAFIGVVGAGMDVSCDDSELGIFRKVANTGSNVFNVKFNVSKYPGDNYRVAMYGDKDFLMKLRNEDQYDQEKIVDMTTGIGNSSQEMELQYTSPVLGEYRTLHIEADKMRKADDVPPANENKEIREAYIENFELVSGSGTEISKIKIIDESGIFITPNDGSQGPGRFERGDIKIGNIAPFLHEIDATNSNEVFFPPANNKPYFNGLNCLVTKPGAFAWSFTVEKIEKTGATTFKVTAQSPNLGLPSMNGASVYFAGSIIESGMLTTISGSNTSFTLTKLRIPVTLNDDDKLAYLPHELEGETIKGVIKTYEEANIIPVFDGGGELSNNNYIPFLINLESGVTLEDYYDTNANSKSLENNDYWVSYIVLGWQGVFMNDMDPTIESAMLGITSANEVPDAHCNVTNGWNVSLICIETLRDYNSVFDDFVLNVEKTISHEIGHQFGLTHGFPIGGMPGVNCVTACIPDCNLVGVMTDDPDLQTHNFVGLHLNLLKSRTKSPKK